MKNKSVISLIRFARNVKRSLALGKKVHIFFCYLHFLYCCLKLMMMRLFIKNRNSNRKILAIALTEHIGDLIASEPVAHFLRKENPDAFIVWAVDKKYALLVENNPSINLGFSIICYAEWLKLKRLKFFDAIIDLHQSDKECLHGVPAQCLNKKKVEITLTKDNYLNFGNLLAGQCHNGGLPVLKEASKFYIPIHVRKKIDRLHLPANFISIHGSSSEKVKNWPAANWRELVRRIIRQWGFPVVEIGLRTGLHLQTPFFYNFCGQFSLLESAEIIRRSCFFIGVDSGPAHMANSFSIPAVILMARFRNFVNHMPFNGAYEKETVAKIIRQDRMERISVEEVMKCLEKFELFQRECAVAARKEDAPETFRLLNHAGLGRES